MKKLIIILSIAAFTFSSKSQAQALFFTSYGTQHLWGMPAEVQWALESNYYNYHMVHTRRFYDRGRLFFDVVLQRGDVFVDIRIGGNGYIFNTVYRQHYPFYNHVCSGYCGFHRDYYMSYRVAYGHPHFHKHNHVYYRPNVVYVRHDHGNHHGHYKNNNNQGRSYRIDRTDNGRVERVNQTPARGSRPTMNRGNNGVRDHGAGVGRGNGQGGNGSVGNNGNQGPRGNNGVRDHGVGEGRGNGQGKGQGFGNGNGNSGRVHQASNSRTSSSARISSPARSSSPARVSSSRSSSRTSVSSGNARTNRSSNSSGSSRSSSGRTVRTR